MISSKLSLVLAVAFWSILLISCTSDNAPQPVNCELSDLAINFTSTDPTACSSKDGSITAIASGGLAPYQFSIDMKTFVDNASFSGLGAGTYPVKVMDKNGCERMVNVTLHPSGSTLSATTQLTDSGCGTKNGGIVIQATGGKAPYSYQLNEGTPTTTNAFYGLGSGTYAIRITDSESCSITQLVTVLSGVKFSTQIKPIIDTYCAIPTCHMEGGNISFKVLSNIQASAKDVKSRTQSGNMPKGGPKLQQADIDLIACWVDDGARDN